MAITTYTELQTAVGTWLERDDLTSEIPDLISLADANIRRDVRIREMLTRSSITVNARTITLPSDFVEARRLHLTTTPRHVVNYVTPQEMDRLSLDSTGKPEWYTILDNIEFDRAPDQSYSGELVYYAHVEALSGSNASNEVLANHPDIYLYGALAASAPLLMHDERVNLWASLYTSAVKQANLKAQKSMTQAGNKTPRVVGRGP